MSFSLTIFPLIESFKIKIPLFLVIKDKTVFLSCELFTYIASFTPLFIVLPAKTDWVPSDIMFKSVLVNIAPPCVSAWLL